MTFLLLLLIVGGAQVYLTFHSSVRFLDEVDQKLNLNLAKNMAGELEPLVKDSLSIPAIKQSIHYMMVMNPKVEIYLTDHTGKILAFFADPPQKVEQKSIDLQPIFRFLKSDHSSLILGPDPRHPDEQKPFSASGIRLANGETGYMYIILGGEQYENALNMVKDSYILQTSLKTLMGILFLAGIIGLILFAFLTRRLRRMSTAVEAFEAGDLKRRILDQSNDEVGELAGSFNRMADTIVSNMDELKNTDKLRRELIANVSHDLRGPLASIHGYLETIMIKAENLSVEERERYLQVIHKNTATLNKLVSDLFELSKLDAKQIEARIEPFSIAELAQDVVMKYKPSADRKHLSIRMQPEGTIPLVNGDIGLVERALTNLIDNSIRYTPENGEIIVRVRGTADGADVIVEDSGPGIAKDDIIHLFDRFYRVEKSRNRDDGGSGLGLAIAQKVLEIQDIPLSVESTVGIGTQFKMHLQKVG